MIGTASRVGAVPPALRDELAAELRRLGDDIVARGRGEGRGMSWPSVTSSGDRSRLANLWCGAAGISLFLLELSRFTGDREYLDAAMEGVRWAEGQCVESDPDLRLYTGSLGVALVLLRLADHTGDTRHLRRARRLVDHGKAALDRSDLPCDLMSGVAGTLLGLLHLHRVTDDADIAGLIGRCARRLVDGAHHGREGLYWDRTARSRNGRCGVAHGASGVAAALLALARHLDRPGYAHVAEQAFLYEDQFFDADRQSWPDLRVGLGSGEAAERRLEEVGRGDYGSFLRAPPAVPVWCRGAAGIGLVRLHAYTLLDRPRHLQTTYSALAGSRTYVEDVRRQDAAPVSFSLCHGLGAPAELFLEGALGTGNSDLLSTAVAVAERALRQRRERGSYVPGLSDDDPDLVDSSLFVGDAGVGYFFLRLLDPGRTPSVLLPRLGAWWTRGRAPRRRIGRTQRITAESPLIACARTAYPRSTAVVDEVAPGALGRLAAAFEENGPAAPSRSLLEETVEEVLDSASRPAAARLRDLFDLESTRLELDLAVRSHALVRAKRIVAGRRASAVLEDEDPGEWTEARWRLADEAHLVTTRWSWQGDVRDRWRKNADRPPGTVPVLLLQTAERVAERGLTAFEHLVLSRFDAASSIPAAVDEIDRAVEVGGEREDHEREALIRDQIREAIRGGVLVDATLFGGDDG